MTGRANLIVFVKSPRPGHVKRRLAAGLGPVHAARVYRGLVATLLRRLAGGPAWRRFVFIAPAPGADRRLGRWHPAFRRRRQSGGDLGDRMRGAFRQMPPGPSLLIGSDIPGVERHHLAAALAKLRHADAVFGPAPDGGYWLVGFRRRPVAHGIFKNVRWSGPDALADSVRSLPPPMRVAKAATLRDIYDLADWRAWQARRRRAGG